MKTPLSILLAAALAAPAFAQVETEPTQKPKVTEATAEAVEEVVEEVAAKPAPLEMGKRLDGATLLPDIDGKMHKAKDYQGKIVVLNFWSTTCPVMKGYEATVSDLQAKYGKEGVVFLMVNSNEGNGEIADAKPANDKAKPYQSIRDYLKTKKLDRTVLIDHNCVLADQLGAKTTPDIFVFDKSGRLSYRGLIDDDARGKKGDDANHHLADALDALIAGNSVSIQKTEPQGCSIKRPKKAQSEGDGENKGRDGERRRGGKGGRRDRR